ncbi:MAG: hypothetical protein Fur006_41020 [Coleofasciculaceae cyanobacterium]|jgi:hypothetical protein
MAYITISDLRPAGSELFMDSESFMNDLVDGELEAISGGATPTITTSSTWCVGGGLLLVSAVVGWFAN